MDEQLIENNTKILMSFDQRVIRGRVRIELERMYHDFAQITIEINDKSRPVIIVYDINEYNKLQKYEFAICEDYPFKPPSIFFQNRPYKEFLQISHSPQELKLFKKISGLDCLCCSSITCVGNWSPGYMMTNIIDEIRKIREYKRNVIIKIIADKIKKQYLIEDIELDSWLF